MVKKRNELSEEYIWAIEEIYDSKDIEDEISEIKSILKEVKEYKGKLSDKKVLKEFLSEYSILKRRFSTLYKYASMKKDQDTSNQQAQGLMNKINSLNSKISQETSFVQSEIQGIGQEKIERFIEEDQDIAKFDFYLKEILRMKPHTRSLEVEEVISSMSEVLSTPSETYSVLSNADIEFPEVDNEGEKVKITQANFTKLLKSNDRDLRQNVYETYYEELESYKNTIGTTYNKEVRSNIKLAEIKNYNSAREASLKPDNIPVEVYDNLTETINDNLDVLHRHLKLKAEKKKLEEPGMHDVYVPIPDDEGPEISYDEAKEHVLKALKPLGEEYIEKLRNGLNNRWIDVYETKGKRSGAYSGGSYDTRPFILMNYQSDIDSVYTLAHELGHSMHSLLSSENQPYLHSNYNIFVAEVASTVNELLLTEYFLENSDNPEFKKHVLTHVLENYRSTLYRQTMFAEFEKQIHESVKHGDSLNPEKISEIFRKLKSNYYKPYELDEHIKYEWMRIPHFYYQFYVFQYATGISAANMIRENIEEKGSEQYISMLKQGGNKPSIDLLSNIGVDMTNKEPVIKAIKAYEKKLSEMENLVRN